MEKIGRNLRRIDEIKDCLIFDAFERECGFDMLWCDVAQTVLMKCVEIKYEKWCDEISFGINEFIDIRITKANGSRRRETKNT